MLLERVERGRQPRHDARPAARRPAPAGASSTDITGVIDTSGPIGSVDFSLNVTESNAGDTPTPSDVRRVADLTVVLVEPSRAQASIVRKYLQELGIENVRVTGSGREALELAKQEGTDVILSSMHLADMTGVQLAQALHDDPGCSGVGFVLASSESDGGEASKALDAPLTVLLAEAVRPRAGWPSRSPRPPEAPSRSSRASPARASWSEIFCVESRT